MSELAVLMRELKTFADAHAVGSLRIGMDEVRLILKALEAATASPIGGSIQTLDEPKPPSPRGAR